MSEKTVKPSRLIGNIYFTGSYKASTHVIDTGSGLIMIDPGYSYGLGMVIENMHAVGLSEKDIKYILVSHAHLDHMDAVSELVEITGAKTFIGKDDLPLLRGEIYHYDIKTFEPDHLISDGEIITLGNTSIRCVSTPGHTDGTVSFFFDVEEDGKTYLAGMFGGGGTNTLKTDFLVKNNLSFDCREKFLNSIELMKREKVEVFLGNHVVNNKTDVKIELLGKTDKNPFIDPEGWQEYLRERYERAKYVIENE